MVAMKAIQIVCIAFLMLSSLAANYLCEYAIKSCYHVELIILTDMQESSLLIQRV